MTRISTDPILLKDKYTAIVVGSGYGASIAASRIARAGISVCILERGREIRPGAYPDDTVHALEETQIHGSHFPAVGKVTGLFDVRINEDISVVVGCGLGGTSLINANVALKAVPEVFQDPRWPAALRNDVEGLDQGYCRAIEMLQPMPYPSSLPVLPKLEALRKSAASIGGKFTLPPITVTFHKGTNSAGVEQEGCTLCGNCCSGCNAGAKNSLLMNYLPDAVKHGAQIFTQVLVHHLEYDGEDWRVFYSKSTNGLVFDQEVRHVSAEMVILGAGSLGSTEILLRSKKHGLPMSLLVGSRFSGNGDVLGFGFNSKAVINGMGTNQQTSPGGPVGPCITGMIDLRDQGRVDEGFVIEEGSIPQAFASFLIAPLAVAAGAAGANSANELARIADSLLRGPFYGALNQTQTFLAMSHDDGKGRMSLDGNRLHIEWPGVGGQSTFQRVNTALGRATSAIDGTYVANPTWKSNLLHNGLVTVHPLGGCVMGEDAEQGVVDHTHRVFAGDKGTAVYPGLYVMDGSVVPRPLGVNPLLTISALSERAVALLARSNQWQITY